MSIFDEFEEPNETLPDLLIYEQIKDFEVATHGLATINIIELDDRSRLSGIKSLYKIFQFRIILTSQYMKGYSFDILDFGYDVDIYPVVADLESAICDELKLTSNDLFRSHKVTSNNEDELIKLITAIFNTNKFKKTVGGLMKLARARGEIQ